MTEDRYQKGLQTMRKFFDAKTEQIVENMQQIFPDLAKMNVESFGEIYGRSGLDKKTRELLAIAALITLGHSLPQLKVHIAGALNVGVSKEEILETILQMTAYAGYPAALNALYVADEIFKELGQE